MPPANEVVSQNDILIVPRMAAHVGKIEVANPKFPPDPITCPVCAFFTSLSGQELIAAEPPPIVDKFPYEGKVQLGQSSSKGPPVPGLKGVLAGPAPKKEAPKIGSVSGRLGLRPGTKPPTDLFDFSFKQLNKFDPKWAAFKRV